MAKVVDPNSPKPEGAIISPARGEPIRLPASLPSSMDAALQRFGTACHKTPVATVLDQQGRPSISLTYGKKHFSIVDSCFSNTGYFREAFESVT